MTVKPNELIAGYHFVQKLGDGGTGTVWVAREANTHALVTVKLLRPELFPPSKAQVMYERLVSSVTQAGRLTHPNLAQTRTTFHQPRLGMFGIVSEYLDGQTLDGIYIPKGEDGRPGASDAHTLAGVLGWFQQVATVLAWLHANGIVHGNVKPRNVMLMTGYERPTIKLLDLCWSHARITSGAPQDQKFVAPEQLAGLTPTPATDQWACSKLLHQLLVSSAPPGTETQALATAPVPLLRVVQRGLQKDPKERFPDSGAFFYALEAVRNQLEQQAGPRETWEAEKRISPTSLVESVSPKRPDQTVGLSSAPTVPVSLPPEPVRAPAVSIDDLFEASEPPLIPRPESPPPPAPPKAERKTRREIERELTEAIEAYDAEDERPPRNWGALIGLGALLLAALVVGGAMYLMPKPKDAPVQGAASPPKGTAAASSPDASSAVPTAALAAAAATDAAIDKSAADSGAPDATARVVVPLVGAPRDAGTAQEDEDLTLLESDCDAKKLTACLELGDRYASGKGVAKIGARAAGAFERACDLGRLSACSRAGDLYLKDGSLNAGKSARRVFEKACDRQVANACAELGRLYAEGIGGPANDRLAKAFAHRACGFGLQSSCEH